jgi:hypothetical protein
MGLTRDMRFGIWMTLAVVCTVAMVILVALGQYAAAGFSAFSICAEIVAMVANRYNI